MSQVWSLKRCPIQPANIKGFVGKEIKVKQINVTGTEETGYIGINEIVNATVKKYEVSSSSWPDYVELEYTNNEGVSHVMHTPVDLFIQYADNAFASLSTTGVSYINEIIDELKIWENTELSNMNLRVLEQGFQ
jgi:hypothetical protein